MRSVSHACHGLADLNGVVVAFEMSNNLFLQALLDRPGSCWLISTKDFPASRNEIMRSVSHACHGFAALNGAVVVVEWGESDDLVGRNAVAGFPNFVRGALVGFLGFLVILCLAERDSDAFFALGSFWVPMTVLSLDS